MTAADSSIIVAAFASWHERHSAVVKALPAESRLIAHCGLEAYSVLTRLPAPHRAEPRVVREFLGARFVAPYLVLTGAAYRSLLEKLPVAGITGGASYDALVAATAERAGATLLTLDGRAARTYELFGARVRMVA